MPIFERRPLAVMAVLQELAERRSRHIDVVVIADNEIHWHIEGVFDVMRERHLGCESELQETRAALVRIGPDMLAETTITV